MELTQRMDEPRMLARDGRSVRSNLPQFLEVLEGMTRSWCLRLRSSRGGRAAQMRLPARESVGNRSGDLEGRRAGHGTNRRLARHGKCHEHNALADRCRTQEGRMGGAFPPVFTHPVGRRRSGPSAQPTYPYRAREVKGCVIV